MLVVGDAARGRYCVVEVNSETDFVARDDNFREYTEVVARTALETPSGDVDALMSAEVGGETLEEARKALVAKVGENITVRRFECIETAHTVGSYVHMDRIGVLVEVADGEAELARDLAMQVAATSPRFVSVEDVPADEFEREREILKAQAEREGKPPEIVEKMVEGRLRKHFDEVTLVGQPFIKDPDKQVRDLLAASGAEVRRFVRYEVGENAPA